MESKEEGLKKMQERALEEMEKVEEMLRKMDGDSQREVRVEK